MTWFDIGMLLVRLSLGGTLIAHGWNHWRGGGRIAGTARWFEGLGLRPGILHAWSSVLVELGAGLMLVLGLLTPLAAAGAVGTMLVALLVVHRRNGFFVFRDGYEYVLMISVFALVLAMLGPGAGSVDHVLGLEGTGGIDLTGLTGLAVAAVCGIGGALLLLACCWRPGRTSRSD